jgi:hypothetical protein
MLGFQPVALLETLVVDPDLPAWMPEVVIENLRIAGATVSLHFWRSDTGKCHAEILRRTGTCRLLVQPPPESTTATARDRFTGILETLMH